MSFLFTSLRGSREGFSSFCNRQGLYRYSIPRIVMLDILSPQVDRTPMTSLLLDEVGTKPGEPPHISVVLLIVLADTCQLVGAKTRKIEIKSDEKGLRNAAKKKLSGI